MENFCRPIFFGVIDLRLPQCEIFSASSDVREVLFIAGGRVPNVDWFRDVAGGRKIFCVDKGVDLCRACEVVPDVLIGDFDSANPDAVAWAREKKIPAETYPADKDFTDTQLALNRAAEIFGEHVALLTGCFGGRLDHMFATLFTCAAMERKIFLADEREIVCYVKDGETVAVNLFAEPLAVSLLPMTAACERVTTKNLHWELAGATLTQNFPNAVSNRADAGNFSVSVGRGTLAVSLTFGAA